MFFFPDHLNFSFCVHEQFEQRRADVFLKEEGEKKEQLWIENIPRMCLGIICPMYIKWNRVRLVF